METFEITRFWIGADGAPHREVAQLLRVPDTHPQGHRFDTDRIEGVASTPLPGGAMRIVTVADPAVDAGTLAVDLNTLYELPLVAGGRLVTEAEWAAATSSRASAEGEARAEVERQLADQRQKERTAERRAILAAIAEDGPG